MVQLNYFTRIFKIKNNMFIFTTTIIYSLRVATVAKNSYFTSLSNLCKTKPMVAFNEFR